MGISFRPVISGFTAIGDGAPAAIDPHFTFARRHIAQVCDKTALVLPVDDIHQTLKSKLRPQDLPSERDLLRAFFELHCSRPSYPDTQVYYPVRVRSVDDEDGPRVWNDLTDVILSLREEKDPAGIILSARSGSGKTVAALKAFLDCLYSPAGADEPRLAGYLPLWIDLEADRRELTLAKAVASQLRLPSLPGDWPRYSPRLLLFFDLNAASIEVRVQMAEQIYLFQKRHGAAGHRCVIAYRSTQDDDSTVKLLTKDRCCVRYDLEPLNEQAARAYFRNIRNFEDKILIAHGLPVRERRIDQDEKRLQEFVAQHASGSGSLISTPLLMHFCSMLEPDEMAEIKTLADLYERVVDQMLERNRQNYPEHLKIFADARRSMLTAMCRVALVLLSDGTRHAGDQESTSITRDRLDQVLRNPLGGKPGGLGGQPWWPEDWSWWHKSSYFKERFGVARGRAKGERELEVLREFSLLRNEASGFRFLHDSFLYYFAAVALRYYEGPGTPGKKDGVHAKWPAKVVNRIRENPRAWLLPPGFLGGMLEVEQAKALAGAIISAEPKPGLPAVLLQLLRGMGEVAEEDEILWPVLRFLDREQHRLTADPERLYQEIYGELAVVRNQTAVGAWLGEQVNRPLLPETLLIRMRPIERTCAEIRCFRGHKAGVRSAVFNGDGTQIVTASEDGTAQVWDAQTGKPVVVLNGHKGALRSAVFNRDGTLIVTASDDGTARLWDAQTGTSRRELKTFRGYTQSERVCSAEFSPDGTWIVTASRDGTARVWDAQTAKLVVVLKGHRGALRSAVFNRDGTLIVTASDDGTARLWDAQTGTSRWELKPFRGYTELEPVCSAQFSPDGTLIVTASDDGTVRLWDAQSGRPPAVLKGHTGSVFSAVFNVDGTKIVTTSHDGTARLWDAKTGEALRVLESHFGSGASAVFNHDGTRVITASDDGTARVWDAQTGKPVVVLGGDTGPLNSAVFNRDGTLIVTASNDGTARLWDVHMKDSLAAWQDRRASIVYTAFCSDGTRIVTQSSDGTIQLWDAKAAELLVELNNVGKVSTAFNCDGTLLFTVPGDGTVRLWDAQTGAPLAQLNGHCGGVVSAVFGPNGRQILTLSGDGTARLWNAQTGAPLPLPQADNGRIISAVFNRDGTRIVTASRDGTTRIVDVRTGEILLTLTEHRECFYSAALNHQETRILTVSDGVARLWDTQTKTLLNVLKWDLCYITSAAFSQDGTRVITEAEYSVVQLWDAQTGEFLMDLDELAANECSGEFSPDGPWTAKKSGGGIVQLQDARTGATCGQVWADGCSTVAVSPCGTVLVVGDTSGRVHFWRIENSVKAILKAGGCTSGTLRNRASEYPDMVPVQRRKRTRKRNDHHR